jgi:NAD(P)-dependent dehydrogenase (short-subunit alcohol dehydrogenase family)
VNVTANWRFVRTLDPLFQRSDAARLIFVTSSVAQSCRPYWAPYSISKAALEALAKTYANETAGTKIRVNLVDPGAMATPLRAQAYPGEDQAALPRPEQITEIFVKLAMPEAEITGQLFTPEA